jgi:hypothetical protein
LTQDDALYRSGRACSARRRLWVAFRDLLAESCRSLPHWSRYPAPEYVEGCPQVALGSAHIEGVAVVDEHRRFASPDQGADQRLREARGPVVAEQREGRGLEGGNAHEDHPGPILPAPVDEFDDLRAGDHEVGSSTNGGDGERRPRSEGPVEDEERTQIEIGEEIGVVGHERLSRPVAKCPQGTGGAQGAGMLDRELDGAARSKRLERGLDAGREVTRVDHDRRARGSKRREAEGTERDIQDRQSGLGDVVGQGPKPLASARGEQNRARAATRREVGFPAPTYGRARVVRWGGTAAEARWTARSHADITPHRLADGGGGGANRRTHPDITTSFRDSTGGERLHPAVYPSVEPGGMPERPKGAACKVAGVCLRRFESSSRHNVTTGALRPRVMQRSLLDGLAGQACPANLSVPAGCGRLSDPIGGVDLICKNSYSLRMKAVVSQKGQVTIPKALRERLGIGPARCWS